MNLIATWLAAHNLTDDEFAVLVGVSRPHASRLRRKANWPSPELAKVIQEKTGLPWHQLIRQPDERKAA